MRYSGKQGNQSSLKASQVRTAHPTEFRPLLGDGARPVAERRAFPLALPSHGFCASRKAPRLDDQSFLPLWSPGINRHSGTPEPAPPPRDKRAFPDLPLRKLYGVCGHPGKQARKPSPQQTHHTVQGHCVKRIILT